MKNHTSTYVAICLVILSVILQISVKPAAAGTKSGNHPVTVVIQPFADMPASLTDHVATELKGILPFVVVKSPIQLPATSYYSPRNRFRADTLIKYLAARTKDNQVTIGITTRDISTTKGNVEDWGVMGLSYCPGKSCVASSFRLSRSDKAGQLFKVAVHELGHTQGLNHCIDRTCLMRDAEGKNTFSEETGFCIKCRTLLSEKGWRIKM